MRRNRRNCRLRLGLADRARGRGIAAGRYYNSRIAKLFPRFSGQPQQIDQTKVNAVDFLPPLQTPARELFGMAGQTKFGRVVGRRAFGAGWNAAGPDQAPGRSFTPGRIFRWELSRSLDRCSLPPPTLLRLGGQGGAAGVDERYRKAQSSMP
jgi:hypothetical protein